MDTPTCGDTVRALATDGQGAFYETTYEIPELNKGDILVKAVMTGVCRSDVAMMQGDFQLLPANMHGHEGLGINTATGEHLGNVQDQDIATNTPAIIKTAFFNCYSFGNGVESWKIQDSIIGKELV